MRRILYTVLILLGLSPAIYAEQDKWQPYIDGTIGKPNYYLLSLMLQKTKPTLPCRALDLGSGAGNEVVSLLARGCSVLAVDLSARSGVVIKARAKFSTSHLTFEQTSFEQAKLSGKYDFVLSYFSLPFAKKENLTDIIANISLHTNKGGLFSANFFGPKHDFVKHGLAFSLTENEIKNLLKNYHFRDIYFLHRQYSKKDFSEQDTFWDIYDVIAIRE